MVHQRGTTNLLSHTHCIDEQSNDNLAGKTLNRRIHLHRSRSKTVSTTPSENNRCDMDPTTLENCRISKRKSNQVRLCSQPNVPRLEYTTERRTAQSIFNETDHLNGNVMDTVAGNDTRKLNNISPRLIGRNHSRTTTKCNPIQQSCSKVAVTNTLAVNTSMKRGKRTLSSTQIEHEKSDEKNIKVLKKHVVLRSLSPLLIATGSTRTKKVASNTK